MTTALAALRLSHRGAIIVNPAKPETLPPKDGRSLLVLVTGRTAWVDVRYDAAWGGGRGGWFTEQGTAVIEKSIVAWEDWRIK